MIDVTEYTLFSNDAAKMAGRHPVTFRKDRARGYGPPYIKLGNTVRYRERDIQDWLAGQLITPGRV